MTTAPGDRLGDRYTLDAPLARGGMGEVWRATDDILGRSVAVKVLHAEGPGAQARFRDEARHAAGLSHPGIASVYDFGETADGTAYLVMELVDGEPLSTVIDREGPLPPERALDIAGQAGFALQAAHDAGVVHRDVKPANLLVRPDGVVKVTDFGIARAVDGPAVTQTGLVVGTAAYLSPEQARGEPATSASDVYSLGVVLFECLTGRRPYDGDSAVAVALAHAQAAIPDLPADVPSDAAALVRSMLAKDAARRPSSAGEAARSALALAVAPPPVTAATTVTVPASPTATAVMPPVVTGRPMDAGQQRRVRNALVGVGVLVVLVGLGLLKACGGPGPRPLPRPSVTPRASTPAATVTVRAGDYVGLSAATATARLTALGLHVTRSSVTTTSVAAGNVAAVTPTGQVRRGATVTLSVATPPAAPPPHHKDGGKKKKDDGTVAPGGGGDG